MYMKPTQLVQYPEDTGEHLHFFPNYWGPTGVNSDVRVEVERVEGSDGSSSSADLVGVGGADGNGGGSS
jgi:complex iron-sulfur molybdoenzyme family reductase subunit alpha